VCEAEHFEASKRERERVAKDSGIEKTPVGADVRIALFLGGGVEKECLMIRLPSNARSLF
jgi:hypothetical protein